MTHAEIKTETERQEWEGEETERQKQTVTYRDRESRDTRRYGNRDTETEPESVSFSLQVGLLDQGRGPEVFAREDPAVLGRRRADRVWDGVGVDIRHDSLSAFPLIFSSSLVSSALGCPPLLSAPLRPISQGMRVNVR